MRIDSLLKMNKESRDEILVLAGKLEEARKEKDGVQADLDVVGVSLKNLIQENEKLLAELKNLKRQKVSKPKKVKTENLAFVARGGLVTK